MSDKVKLANVRAVAKDFGKKIVERAQLELGTTRSYVSGSGKSYRGKKVASDSLRKGLRFIVKKQKDSFRMNFGSTSAVSDYAGVVHFGRRRGAKQPPSSELVAWLKKKGFRAKDPDTGAFVRTKEYHYRGMAYVIARSIKEHGTPAFPYYSLAFKHYDTQLTDALLKALTLDVDVIFD